MTKLAFNPPFTRAMHCCRSAVYVWFGGAAWLIAWLTTDASIHPAAIASGVAALVCWLLLSISLRRPRLEIVLLGLHLLECAIVLLCARVWALSAWAALSLLLVALAANTALWGWRRLTLFVPAAGVGYGVGGVLSGATWHADLFWADVWFVCGGMLFVLAICAVSHSQAQQLVGLSRHLRDEKLTLLRYLPSDLPAHLQHQQQLTVRRQWMTVVFIDLVGFTKATNELPPEALAEFLNRFMVRVDHHVESWGGHVTKFLGDGVLCVFPGIDPGSRRNSAAQAVRCVGLLPEVMRVFDHDWRSRGHAHTCAVRCGVASGYCCSGDWGGDGRLDYTVIGPTVNLAQRLQVAAADFGGVLLDETTQQLANHTTVSPAANRIAIKGLGHVLVYPLFAH